MDKRIKAILIDSGRVLNSPVTGHWFITPNFLKHVDGKAFYSVSKWQRDAAFTKASEYISRQSLILTEEEEFNFFVEYYSIFFRHLPNFNLGNVHIESVAKDLVYNYNKYKFYKDVTDIIPKLSVKYKLAVVSDAWPSLENVFKKAGLRGYFSSFVISSRLGVTKPNELMYTTALKELNVSPDEAIFIDDSVKNCNGAKKLGMHTYLLCRDYRLYIFNKAVCRNHKVIRNLKSLSRLI